MNVETQAIQLAAPLVGRGYVRLWNIRPDTRLGIWICDECHERVIPSKRADHARKAHGVQALRRASRP